MTKREKFYFSTLYEQSQQANFHVLYDFIEENPHLGYKDWKKYFRQTKIGKNLSYELNYLNKQILRALHIYRLNVEDPNSTILKLLNYVHILLEKGENKQARKILLRAKKLAYDFEEYSILVKIITIQEELDISTIDSDLPNKMRALREEREQCIVYIQNYFELKQLKVLLIDLQYKQGLSIDSYDSIFKSDLLESPSKALTKKAMDHWYFSRGMVEYYTGNYDLAMELDYQRYHFLNEHQDLFPAVERLKCLNNLAFSLIDAGRFEESEKMVQDFKRFQGEPTIPDSLLDYFYHYLSLRNYSFSGRKHKINLLLPSSLQKIRKHRNELNPTQLDEWYFNLCTASLQIEDWSGCMDIINEWEQIAIEEHNNINRKLAKLICSYELNSKQLLANELKNYKSLIRKKRPHSQTYKTLAQFFRLSLKYPHHSEIREQLVEQLEDLSKQKAERAYFMELNILHWACS